MRILLIDDTRNLTANKICRDYNSGIEALRSETWDLLLLDHDLASYDSNNKEQTGYDIMCFLECNPQHLPKEIQCVSANPVGAQRINMLINKLYKRS